MDVRFQGQFPLWQATLDGRRIVSLNWKRSPVPLMASGEPGSPYSIGRCQDITIRAGHSNTTVVVHGQLDAEWFLESRPVLLGIDLEPDPASPLVAIPYYLGPDIDVDAVSQHGPNFHMSGTLLTCTLYTRPSWPEQPSVLITRPR